MDGTEREKDDVLKGIASKIKHLRRRQGLSVNTLAERTGFAKSYLSQIENCKREPAIGTLVTIARALGVSVFSLIDGEKSIDDEESLLVVKPLERRRVTIPFQSADTVYESINYRAKDKAMDAYVLTPGFEFPTEAWPHEGQELVYVLEGRQELVYNGRSYVLNEGDACYFDAGKRHYARSIGDKLSKNLVVYTTKK